MSLVLFGCSILLRDLVLFEGKKVRMCFFFYSEILEEDRLLFVGDIVTFNIEIKPKGPRAFDIKKEGSLKF